MRESEYFFNQERIHLQVADNPCYDAWIRASNRASAARCRQSAREALETEAHEARLAEAEDREEQLAIDEIRYENVR